MHMRLLSLAVLFCGASAVANNGGHNATHWQVQKCKKSRGEKYMLPTTPCGRTDLGRGDLCSLLAQIQPLPEESFPMGARVHANRWQALLAHVANGGSLVEVGTMTGVLARFMLRELRPKKLTVMDISGWAFRQCQTKTKLVANSTGAELTCLAGNSKVLLAALPDAAFDMIYIDGDHEYVGVCSDLEIARLKVKVGGIVVMNDYLVFETQFFAQRGRWGVYGVVHAVNEFMQRYKRDWEVVYYAFEEHNFGDFAIRRLR
mmetsp:Transcript_4636/g.12343  ORF Transcript_4636/g.12343 Transcript_4636/m.12343 type:complete len:260 (-) Transcript_4636:489-1268(-)